MASVLSYLRELNIVTMMLRIVLAVLCGGLMLLMLIYAFRNEQLRTAHPQPATRADAAMATLEKSDEDGA